MTKKPDRPVLTKPAVSGSTVPRDVETTSASGARARALVRRTKDAVREAKKAKYGDRTATFSATTDVNLKSNARVAHAALPADPARRRPRTPDATDAATTSSTADRGATVGRKPAYAKPEYTKPAGPRSAHTRSAPMPGTERAPRVSPSRISPFTPRQTPREQRGMTPAERPPREAVD